MFEGMHLMQKVLLLEI